MRIVRLKVGDRLEIFDGKGNVGACVIRQLDEVATCDIVDRWHCAEANKQVSAIIGVQQSGDFNDVLRSLTELGVNSIHVFRHAKDALFKLQKGHGKRWQRIMLNACKQAKRAWLPRLVLLQSWQEVLLTLQGDFACRYVLDKSGDKNLAEVAEKKSANRVCFVAGSSCGFSEEELDDLQKLNTSIVNLGSNTLQAKTAVVFFAGFLSLL